MPSIETAACDKKNDISLQLSEVRGTSRQDGPGRSRATAALQCFHGQSYKHAAKHCRNALRYRFYAAIGHTSKDCANQGNPEMYRCAVCKEGKKHKSWVRECPVRREQVAKAQKAYLTRPVRFQVRTMDRAPSQASHSIAKDSDNIDDSLQPSIQTPVIRAAAVRNGHYVYSTGSSYTAFTRSLCI